MKKSSDKLLRRHINPLSTGMTSLMNWKPAPRSEECPVRHRALRACPKLAQMAGLEPVTVPDRANIRGREPFRNHATWSSHGMDSGENADARTEGSFTSFHNRLESELSARHILISLVCKPGGHAQCRGRPPVHSPVPTSIFWFQRMWLIEQVPVQ